jgi:beta-exotoxin I transport system ATP-binding protein
VSSDAVIRTSGLSKDYGGGNGLFGLDLEIERGEVFGFLGPNGAGKSTTMRLLLDLIRPTSGSATILGLDTRRESLKLRRLVGYLPGDFELHPRLTGAQALGFFAALQGGVDRRVRDGLVERFDAPLDRPVHELSTGNRQKLGLVQAFMHEPQCLILDEPIAGLDPLVQRSFHDLLAETTAEGRTVFLSSHTLAEVERVAHRVAILRRGHLAVVDTVDNLRRVAMQQLEVEFEGAPPSTEVMRALAGVRDVQLHGQRMLVRFEGSADPIVKAIAQFEVRTLRSGESDLEEVFLRFYRDEAQ